jgi:Arc/MetJ family transcription regulator
LTIYASRIYNRETVDAGKEADSMAKTLLDIERELLEEARRLAKVRTKREAVEVALREFVRRRRADNLASVAGKSTIRWTPADIRGMREGR